GVVATSPLASTWTAWALPVPGLTLPPPRPSLAPPRARRAHGRIEHRVGGRGRTLRGDLHGPTAHRGIARCLADAPELAGGPVGHVDGRCNSPAASRFLPGDLHGDAGRGSLGAVQPEEEPAPQRVLVDLHLV